MNYLVAAAAGVGIALYTFSPLIQARKLEKAKGAGESTETPEQSATRAGPDPATDKVGTQSEVGKK